MKPNEDVNRRILIIDDTESIHEDFREILGSGNGCGPELAEEESAIFGFASESPETDVYEIDSAFQGQEGLEKVQCAAAEGRPYAMAFVDIRMPPGWDGIVTIKRIWQTCPHLQVILCSAYSDYQWRDITKELGPTEKLVILKKPYDNIEVQQLASALTMKWTLENEAVLKQAELNQQSETLKRLLSEANTLRVEAESANVAKSEFLANMSHELRTPLHAVLSFAGFGIKKHASAKPEKLLEYFTKINKSATVLIGLLNDLLDLAKLESGKMVFTPEVADLDVLVDQVREEFTALLQEQDVTLEHKELDPKKTLKVDVVKIKQVLRNLISNALKFSPHGSQIGVQLSDEGDDSVLIRVSNQGPSIPEDELEIIFDKFVQSSQTKSGAGGTGLGLAICKEIVATHGGRVWAENHPKDGVAFSVTLPVGGYCGIHKEAALVGG